MPPKSRSFKISAMPISIVAHSIFIAVAALVLVWLLHFEDGFAFQSPNKIKILNVHTFLMVVGFILVSGEAITAYKTIPAERKVQKTVHMSVHLIATVSGVLGVYAAFKFNHEVGAKDMVTLHSWLGMATICLFGLQWVLGFFSYVFPRAEMSARTSYMPWHIFGGMFIFCLGICTALTGLIERSEVTSTGLGQQQLLINFIGVLLVLYAIGIGLCSVLPRSY